MTKPFIRISAAAAIAFTATAAYAQSGSMSDVAGPTQSTVVTFAPLGTPGGGTGGVSGGVSGASVSSTAGSLSSGNVTSPVTGQAVPPAAAQQVGALMSGSVPAVAQVSAALTSAGAPAGATASLTQALAALAGATSSSSPGLVTAAANAFNSLLSALPASFFAAGTLPPQFLAIHAALVQMVGR